MTNSHVKAQTGDERRHQADVRGTQAWTVEFYQDEKGREPCREWMEKLSPTQRDALITAIDVVLAERGLDVMSTEYGKPLGDGLYEFRLRWTAAEVRHKAGRVSDAVAAKAEKILLRVFSVQLGGRSSCF